MRAAIYCRVSTEDQEKEGTSLGSQVAACLEKAKELGYEVPDELIFKEVLKTWDGYPDRCCFLKREQKNAMGPYGRYDRSYWRSDRTGLIDAHTPRPAYTDEAWPTVKALIRDCMPEYLTMLDEYRNYYCEDLGIHIG